jgi:hypothetical protein
VTTPNSRNRTTFRSESGDAITFTREEAGIVVAGQRIGETQRTRVRLRWAEARRALAALMEQQAFSTKDRTLRTVPGQNSVEVQLRNGARDAFACTLRSRALSDFESSLRELIAEAPPPNVVRGERPGRNEPCPCGSGLKYKKCCDNRETADEAPTQPARSSEPAQTQDVDRSSFTFATLLRAAISTREFATDVADTAGGALAALREEGKPLPSDVIYHLGSVGDTLTDLAELASTLAGRQIDCRSFDELIVMLRQLVETSESPLLREIEELSSRAERLRLQGSEERIVAVDNVLQGIRNAVSERKPETVEREVDALQKLLAVVGGSMNPEDWRSVAPLITAAFGPEVFGRAVAGQLHVGAAADHEGAQKSAENNADNEHKAPQELRDSSAQQPVGEDDAQATPRHLYADQSHRSLNAAVEEKATGNQPEAAERSEKTDLAAAPAQAPQADIEEVPTAPPTRDVVAFAAAPSLLSDQSEALPVTQEHAIEGIAWKLLKEGRYAIAYQLLTAAEEEKPSGRRIPSWIAAALALAPRLRFAEGRIAQRLRDLYQRFDPDVFVQNDEEWNYGLRCLFAASSFRPALLSPYSGAAALLPSLSWKSLDNTRRLCDAIADFGSTGLPLDPTLLNATRSEVEWNVRLDSLMARSKSWLDGARQKHLIYHRATRVWQKWTHEGGWIHELVSLAATRHETAIKRLENLVSEFMHDDRVKQAIQEDDRKQRRSDEDIGARALQQLLSHATEALDFGRERLLHETTKPNRASEFTYNQTRKLRSAVEETGAAADSELVHLASEHAASTSVTAGVAVLRRSIEDLAALLTHGVLPTPEHDPDMLLAAELLQFSGIDVRKDWNWKAFGNGTPVETLVSELAEERTWSNAFHVRCEAGDLAAAERILELTGHVIDSGLDIERADQTRAEALRRHRTVLNDALTQTRARVETATWRGTLSDSERDRLISRIEGIERQNAAHQVQQFAPLRTELEAIREELASGERDATQRVRARLDGLALPENDNAKARIVELLDQHDLLTANEYIDGLAEGKPLPEPARPTLRVADFFPDRAREIEHWFETGDLARALDAHSRGQNLPGLPFGEVPGGQRKSFEPALRAFAEMKRLRRGSVGNLQTLFGGIGFANVQVTPADSNSTVLFVMKTRPIADREVCPVPAFGSFARGTYRALCVFDRRSMEDIVREVDSSKGDAAIVLHFGFLTESRRRELARLSRQSKHRVFLLLDDILLLHLAAQRGARLSAFFHSTLPFTAVDPYVTAAGNVPREMFFGRDHERAEILAPRGSSFIFGGRQLGKTALLRDAERAFHSPEEGRVAKWIDTKAEGLGYNRTIGDIWQVLTHHLAPHLELPHGIAQFATFAKRVEEWLQVTPGQRRVVLLLDEADEFLAKDAADDFSVTRQLKNLMERTDGHFKVVFAGLHNVQRTTRLANHPLAHFGSALCIGPLLGVHDIRDGRALVEEPLRAAGYEFKNPDLPTLILSQTNYYPSLIQLYCKQLLKHISDFKTAHFDTRSGPPFEVTARHVEEAYRSRDLRREIRERFHLTLQLDPRYEVIALAIANGSLSGDDDEISVRWIRDEVACWWPAGFTDSSNEALRALLDEMVGLGVLRHGRSGGYALRSPNVVALLGTQREIEEALLREREMTAEYEPSSYHALLDVENQTFSPFTAFQSSELLSASGVAFVAGSEAAGMAFARKALEKLGEEREYRVVGFDEPQSFVKFKKALETLAKDRSRSLVCLVSPPQWDARWVRDTASYVATLRSRERILSVVFLGGPAEAWRWVEAEADERREAAIKTISLRPWQDGFIRRWMADQGFPSDAQSRAHLLDMTGGWPTLIADVRRRSGEDPLRWRQGVENLRQTTLPLTAFIGDRVRDRVAILGGLKQLGQGQVTIDELAELLDAELTFVRHTIAWASLIAVVTIGGDGRLRLNPAVAAALPELA